MRRRIITPEAWHTRLNSLMRDVLAHPERYHPSMVRWAEWRRRWLATEGRKPHKVVATPREDHNREWHAGPSWWPRPAGGQVGAGSPGTGRKNCLTREIDSEVGGLSTRSGPHQGAHHTAPKSRFGSATA